MKIAWIGQKGIPATFGGVEYHVDRLSRGLAARHHQGSVYVRNWYTDRRLKRYDGVKLISVPTLRTKHLDAAVHCFLSSVHCLFTGAQIIHYQGMGPSLFSFIPRLFGRKVVATIHRLDWATEKWGPVAKYFLKMGERFSVRIPHRTITVSEEIKKYVRNHYGKEAVYIPNGIQQPQVRPLRALGPRYGLSSKNYILFMGRLVPEKRPDWLIRAFLDMQAANDSFKPLKLVIAGGSSATDDYVRKIHDAARTSPSVIFPGYVWGEDKEELLSHALLFVLPSYLEGAPIALLEAKSYGLCCLASDIIPHRDVIQHGRDGWLFRSGSREDFKTSLRTLVKQPEILQRLGRNARASVQKRLSWDDVVEMTIKIYRDVLDGKRL